MCGIIGFNSSNKELGEELNKKILHRGPDDSGVFSDSNVTLGNRRLAILDLSPLGHQPMVTPDGLLALVFNGEIYNYKELKRNLIIQGCVFKSDSDTEVILNGYKKYGSQFLEKLRGMWGLAFYEKDTQKLVLSRDIFGIKPLFYYHHKDVFVFGSEIKVIEEFLKSRGERLELSREGVSQYFMMGYTLSPYTVFKNIKKVEPGEIVVFDIVHKRLSTSRLSTPEQLSDMTIKPSEHLRNFEEVMLDSVKSHLVSDVPVGVFLSGGSDSTLIALMMKKMGFNTDAFTVRIEGKQDAAYAKKIADFSGLRHHEISLTAEDFTKAYNRCWQYLDEPIADSSLIPSLAVSEAASEKVKVVLTGEGGDELFWGYDHYNIFKNMPAFKDTDPFSSFINRFRFPSSTAYLRYIRPLSRRIRSGYFRNIRKDLLGSYIENASIDPDLMDRSNLHHKIFGRYGYGKYDPAWMDRHFYLPDNLLYKTDFATMVHSVEGRVPFLDKEVYRFSKSLPPEWKLSGGVGKKIIKEYLSQNLPRELVFRNKEGFSVPLNFYQSKSYREDMREAILFADQASRGLGLDMGILNQLKENKEFLSFFEAKYRHFLFAILAFYKSISKFVVLK